MQLAELVEALAVQTSDGERDGLSLLQQLRDARVSSSGRDGGRSRASERITLNLGAHELWEEITGDIAAQYAAATVFRPTPVPEFNLLAWWAAYSAALGRGETNDMMDGIARQRLEGWHKRIRELFDPPMVRPLRGVACPSCGVSRAHTGVGVLLAEVDALVAHGEDDDLTVSCLACGGEWVGVVEVVSMARHAGLELDPEQIREARRPIAAEADAS